MDTMTKFEKLASIAKQHRAESNIDVADAVMYKISMRQAGSAVPLCILAVGSAAAAAAMAMIAANAWFSLRTWSEWSDPITQLLACY